MTAYLDTAKGLVLLAFLGVCGYFVWNYNHMVGEVAQIAPLQADLKRLTAQQEALSKAAISRTQLDAAIRDARLTTTTKLEQVARDDPKAGAYLDERIPDSVRGAFAEDHAH